MQFDNRRWQRLESLADVVEPGWVTSLRDPALGDGLAEVEVLLTGWGAPRLDAEALSQLPHLTAVLHCAGSVRPVVSEALWERGVIVSSSADLNAVPVAEFTFAAIVMAGKKAPFLAAEARRHGQDRSHRWVRSALGNSGLVIGLVGFSRVGRRVAALLQQLHEVTVLVHDPYAAPEAVAAAGATLIGLGRCSLSSTSSPCTPPPCPPPST